MRRVKKKHTNAHMSLFNIPHHEIFLQLIPLLNSSQKINEKCVETEITSVIGVSK